MVVNCLQFFIFTRFFAVEMRSSRIPLTLWIAYNFLSLQGSLQYGECGWWIFKSCELLTIFYLYKVLCSELHTFNYALIVVNCLQFFIFTRFFAVCANFLKLVDRLWIAYNFLSLQGSLQYVNCLPDVSLRCELLTIFYLYKVLCSWPIYS